MPLPPNKTHATINIPKVGIGYATSLSIKPDKFPATAPIAPIKIAVIAQPICLYLKVGIPIASALSSSSRIAFMANPYCVEIIHRTTKWAAIASPKQRT